MKEQGREQEKQEDQMRLDEALRIVRALPREHSLWTIFATLTKDEIYHGISRLSDEDREDLFVKVHAMPRRAVARMMVRDSEMKRHGLRVTLCQEALRCLHGAEDDAARLAEHLGKRWETWPRAHVLSFTANHVLTKIRITVNALEALDRDILPAELVPSEQQPQGQPEEDEYLR